MENFLRYFKITTLVLPFVLVPFTIILLIAQESIPGNPFYPIKTGLESVILAAASVNPYTKALFTNNLADTRYTEAEKLLLAKGNTSGLHDFVLEVDAAQQNIARVSNPQQKQALAQQLTTQIDTYQNKLQQDQQQAIASAMTQPAYAAPQTKNNTASIIPQQPPAQNQNNPVQTNNQSPVQQNQQAAPPPPIQQTIIIMNISQTQQQLSQIKESLNQPDQSPPASFTPTPTLTPTPQPIINVVTTAVPVKVKGNGNEGDQGNNGNGNGNSGKKD